MNAFCLSVFICVHRWLNYALPSPSKYRSIRSTPYASRAPRMALAGIATRPRTTCLDLLDYFPLTACRRRREFSKQAGGTELPIWNLIPHRALHHARNRLVLLHLPEPHRAPAQMRASPVPDAPAPCPRPRTVSAIPILRLPPARPGTRLSVPRCRPPALPGRPGPPPFPPPAAISHPPRPVREPGIDPPRSPCAGAIARNAEYAALSEWRSPVPKSQGGPRFTVAAFWPKCPLWRHCRNWSWHSGVTGHAHCPRSGQFFSH
jgi:hypothetical protein